MSKNLTTKEAVKLGYIKLSAKRPKTEQQKQIETEQRKADRDREKLVLCRFTERLYQSGIKEVQPEYTFHESRGWRFDLYVKQWSIKFQRFIELAIELEGGIYSNGRHVRGKGFEEDMEKYNAATIKGILLLRFSYKVIATQRAVNMVLSVFGLENNFKEKY